MPNTTFIKNVYSSTNVAQHCSCFNCNYQNSLTESIRFKDLRNKKIQVQEATICQLHFRAMESLMKLNPPTNTSFDRLNNFKSHTPQDNEWRKHGTAGVNESFNVRVEINKRPDLPLWPKEHQGNLE